MGEADPIENSGGSLSQEIRAGIGDVWAVALGLFPLGLAFGLLITQLGFSWWWAPILSIAIYAGSMEFLALSLITGGVGPLSTALYTLVVNFRHVFYALNYPLAAVKSLAGRAYGVYALTDETYAVVSANRNVKWTGPRVITVQLLLQTGWISGGIIGGIGGSRLPMQLEGMEFALTALFTVLAIEAFVGYKDLSLPLTALVAAVVGFAVSPDNMLMIAMSVYFVVLLVRFFVPRVDSALRWKVGGEQQ